MSVNPASAQHRLKAVFMKAPGYIAVTRGPSHEVEFANEACTRLSGLTDIVGRKIADVVPAAHRRGLLGVLDRVNATGKPFRGRDVQVLIDGRNGAPRSRFLEFLFQPITDDAGRVTSVFLQGTDVTSRKIAARALEESERRLRLAQEVGGLGLWDWDVVNDHVVWSESSYRNWGLNPAETTKSYADFIDRLPAAERPRVHALMQAALRGETPYYSETRLPQPDGSVRWIAGRGKVFRDRENKPVRMLGTTLNITERKLAEEALSEQLEITRAITDNANAALFLTDCEGRPRFMNPAAEAMTGCRLADVQQTPIQDIVRHRYKDGRAVPAAECPIAHALRSFASLHDYETVFVRRDGTTFPGVCSVTPLQHRGATRGAVVQIADITDRKRTEQQLHTLVGELNHRVKNTLATVLSIASQTDRNTADRQQFVVALSGRLRALAITHDLLSASQWTGAQLSDVIYQEMLPHGGERSGRLVLSGCDIRLNSNAALVIGMVLHELATNAVKYGALSVPDGRIEIACEIGDNPADGRFLSLLWQESGGPPPPNSAISGFGRTLIERAIEYQLDGSAEWMLRPAGLYCHLQAPLAAIADETPAVALAQSAAPLRWASA